MANPRWTDRFSLHFPHLFDTLSGFSHNEEDGMERIGVVFGGCSGEHEVSLVSAGSIMNALDRTRFDIVPIGITKQGAWHTGPGVLDWLKARGAGDPPPRCHLSPDPAVHGLLIIQPGGGVEKCALDVVFPVLHGTNGEDGSIQGLLQLADIPVVGSGVLGSSVAMDKVMQKALHAQAGLRIAGFVWSMAGRYRGDPDAFCAEVERELGYPVFVKPPNLGSSVGISKATDRASLVDAIELALQYDVKVVVERAIPAARELEVAVLGNEDAIASIPGEIVPSNDFYDYDAKYVDGASATLIPADLPQPLAEEIRRMALLGFHTLGCEGMARVDFLLSRTTGELVINEVNTIPGFTSISMYPKLMEAVGVGYGELLTRLVDLAHERQARQRALRHAFQPRTDWHTQG